MIKSLFLILPAMFFLLLVEDSEAAKRIRIDGSSTVYPVTEGAAEEYQIKKRGKIHVTVGVSGTGGGFKKFCRGEIDITGASRPIKSSEIEKCKEKGIEFIELPICMDALTVVVNPKNDWVDCMSVEELKKIWEPEAQGKITKWNQIRSEWPNKKLQLCGAGVDSGTYDYFTKAIVGKEHSSRGDYTASEDDNVLVQFAANQEGALCFFGYSYYFENKDKLKPVAIKNPKTGKCVKPSPESVLNGEYMPLSRPVFIYVNKSSAERPEVKEFVKLYLENAPDYCSSVGYVPLTDEIYSKVWNKFKNKKTGTYFGGESKVGVDIEHLVK